MERWQSCRRRALPAGEAGIDHSVVGGRGGWNRLEAMILRVLAAMTVCAAGVGAAEAKGEVRRVTVHGKALEGNLAGDTADRPVTVYLPPSYAKSPKRRYPVLYLLHGFTDSDSKWMGFEKHFIHVPEVVDRVVAAGAAKEMIVVMPNAYTKFAGSMYSVGANTGDWETFVAEELVAWVDKNYRTLARAESRGLAGHSMGGYGAIRLAMRKPGVFSRVYAMSPCCLLPPAGVRGAEKIEAVKTLAEIEKLDFFTKAALASSAAWSPNPVKGPLFIDKPVEDGKVRRDVLARWAANAPVSMIDQYVGGLRKLKGMAIDMGDRDMLMGGAKELDRMLTERAIGHTFEIYGGDHTNGVSERMEKHVLPFFSRGLVF